MKHIFKYTIALVVFLAFSCFVFYPALKGQSLKMYDIKAYKGNSKELRDYREANNKEAIWTGTSFSGMPGYQTSVHYSTPVSKLIKYISLGTPFPIDKIVIAMICFFILCIAFKLNFFLSILASVSYGLSTFNFTILSAGHTTKMLAIALFPAVLGLFWLVYKSKKEYRFLFTLLFSLFLALELCANHIQMTYYFSFILLSIAIFQFFSHKKSKTISLFFKKSGLIILGSVFAIGMCFSNYYFTYSFAKKSVRGTPILSISKNEKTLTQKEKEHNKKNKTSGLDRNEIVYYSHGVGETFNLFLPNAKGADNLTQNMYTKIPTINKDVFKGYWGDQPGHPKPYYFGVIIVFFALLYLFLIHNTLKWSLLSVSVLALLLGWGRYLGGIDGMWVTDFFINYVPLYSKFRAVSTFFVVINLTVPLMAVLFLQKIIIDKTNEIKLKKTLYVGVSMILFLIIISIFPDFFFTFFSRHELGSISNGEVTELMAKSVQDYRINIFLKDSIKAIALSSIALIGIVLLKQNKIKPAFIISVLFVFVTADKLYVNSFYFNNDKLKNSSEYRYWEQKTGFENTYIASKADNDIYNKEIAKNPQIKTEVNDKILKFKKANSGKISRHEKESIMFSTLNFSTNYRVLDIIQPFGSSTGSKVNYFHKSTGGYNPAILRRYQDIMDFYLIDELEFIKTNEFDKMKVFNMLNNKYYIDYNIKDSLIKTNDNTYGNAWFVDDIKWVQDNNEEILAIKKTDLKSTVIVNKEFKESVKKMPEIDSNASINMVSYSPNHIIYNSNSKQDALAVFSEVYYADGWNAYVDNKKTPYFRANYILRGLNIEKGKHKIEFKFEPSMFTIGNFINNFSFYLVVILIIVSSTHLFYRYKKG